MNVNTIKKIDHVLDYIPVISTGSNLVNIIAKMVFGKINQEPINDFSYFVHLSQKSYGRCITLLIPILGNIAVLLYDTINSASIVLEKKFSLLEVERDRFPQGIRNIEVGILKNQQPHTPITNDIAPKEVRLDSSAPNAISSEEEINKIQQQIRDNYKKFKAQKNQQSDIRNTSRIDPHVFVEPIGINNTSKNCWCISVLQILCNTPLYDYIMSSDSNLQKTFPKLFEFIKTYRERSESSEQLGRKLEEIRIELNKHLGNGFLASENEEADAKQFITELFEKLNLDYYITGFTQSRNEQIKDSIITLQEPCIFIEPHNISTRDLDIDEIFDSSSYELVGVLRTEPAHYSSLVKANNGYWYKCNDGNVSKLLRTFQPTTLEDDRGTFLVGYRKNNR